MKNPIGQKQDSYTIIRSQRRTLALEVTSDARLVIRAPVDLPEKTIVDFIARKSGWIESKMEYVRRNLPVTKSYEEGNTVYFLGKQYPLSYLDNPGQIIDLRDKLYISESYRSRIKGLLISWYIYQGYQIIPKRVLYWSELLGYKPTGIKVTKAEKRWGSCSNRGSLCFSWRLLMTPPEVIDYVIVHELAHLRRSDHSALFWRLVESHLPGYREQREWLKRNNRHLRL